MVTRPTIASSPSTGAGSGVVDGAAGAIAAGVTRGSGSSYTKM
jgi:hypothetical protein